MAEATGPRRPWAIRLACAVAVAYALAVGLVLTSDLPAPVRGRVSGASIVVAAAAVSLSCLIRARSSRGRRRRGWSLVAAATGSAAVGNLWLVLSGMSLGPRTSVSVADVWLLAALVLGALGMASYPRTPRRPVELLRMVLDGILVGGSVCFVLSVTVFPAILGRSGGFEASRAVPLLVPVLDLVAATIAALLLLRSGPAETRPLALAGAGMIGFGVTDFTVAVVTTREPYVFGTPADLGYVVGWLLVGLAVWTAPSRDFRPLQLNRDVSPAVGTVAIFTVFLVAALFSLREARSGGLSEVAAGLWLLVLGGAVGRQVLLMADNAILRAGLERRVDERTRQVRDVTARSDLVVEAVADGIYGLDLSGRVTFVNPAGARSLGYPAGDLVGRVAHGMFHASPPEPGAHSADSCYVRAAVRDLATITAVEDVYVRADGQQFAVEATTAPLSGDQGVLGAVVVFRDVTQRREVERLKNEFVSMVSHELRTPLTSIQATLRMLDAGTLGTLSPQAQRMTHIALDSSARLTRLINDILDIERIGSGSMTMEFGEHRVADLVLSAVRQLRALADRAQVEVLPGKLEGTVVADADRVDQTLVNLIGNAIKFSPPQRTITVDTTVRGTFVEISITDQGRGIPPDRLQQIFERFEQVDSSDAREKGGSGLGLAICRSIVERHGGRIWAENSPAGGAVFRFTLPRVPPPDSGGEANLPYGERQTATGEPPPASAAAAPLSPEVRRIPTRGSRV